MMNFRTLSVAFALTLMLSVPAFAADKGKEAAPAAPAASSSSSYKIGVVDIEQVVENYPKKKRLMDELETSVKSDQAAIDGLTSKLDSLQKAFDAGKDKFTDSDRSAKMSEIRELITKIKAERETKQGKIDQREAEIKSEVFGDVAKAIQQVADSENYHLVLNSRGVPNGAVLYASSTIDITSKVQTQLGNGGK